MRSSYPRVVTEFEKNLEKVKNPFYAEAIERILNHVLPPNFFRPDDVPFLFQKQLPIVCWTSLLHPPFELSFFLFCRFRANAFRFFYEMISRWLIPGKRLNALLQFAADFTIPDFGEQKYIGGEVMVRIETDKEFEIVKQNLPILESDIRLGVESSYQASRILEIKGLNSDEKTALIQENIVSLIRHRPQDFDYDILSEMQRFLVLCKEEFKASRCFKHMSRIICVHYLFRKALKPSLEVYPDRRYISVKLIRGQLNADRPVLGIALGVSFIRDNELFEARHVLSGVRAIVPDSKLVMGSFFINKDRTDPTCTIYLEVEKETGKKFTLEEEKLLKAHLPGELKNRIEQRLNPLFMPQNEEEIMRHILTLSQQLKFIRDLPQVIIDFSQQTEEALEFLVIFLRIVKPNSMDIAQLFKSKPTPIEYVPDRTKIVGSIRKKYKKEASVFRLRIQKEHFLRKDHSVDLHRARQEIAKELSCLIGEFRDYNGGILAKETEIFERLRKKFDGEHTFLLENFFYSLNPPVMRSVLSLDALQNLFLMITEDEAENLSDQFYQMRIRDDLQYCYILLLAKDARFYEALCPVIKKTEGIVASFFIPNADIPCFGVLARIELASSIKFLIENTMTQWSEQFFLLQN